MKQISFVLVLIALISGFSCKNLYRSGNLSDKEQESPGDVPDQHSSREALDWWGVYQGTIPCDDCEGIEIRLVLTKDLSYSLTRKHRGKDDTPVNDQGTFTWNNKGSVITLTSAGWPSTFKVGEGVLFVLDKNGDQISEENASKYSLYKNPVDYQLEARKWKLIALDGKPIKRNEKLQEPFLYLDPEQSRFNGNGSCNSFSGSYDLMPENKIQFGPVASTMMACVDMTIEQTFFRAFEKTSFYRVDEVYLELLDSKKQLLARFEFVPE